MEQISSKNPKKLCFLCDRYLTGNDEILVNSITNDGMKSYIKRRIENFKSLKPPIANIEEYDLGFIHAKHYTEIEKRLSSNT